MVLPQRKPNRYKKWDYHDAGWYFVTLCTKGMVNWFGEIVCGQMVLNEFGQLVNKCFKNIPNRFNHVEHDEFVVMPNHVHGIIVIRNRNIKQIVGTGLVPVRQNTNRTTTRVVPTLGNLIGSFKSITTVEYIKQVRKNKYQSFEKSIWQRSYYDHIIRSEYSLFMIQQYIRNNPRQWEEEKDKPENIIPDII